ncbi:hypothetical protein ACM66B_005400 [Microbotryomycetes sp. NB124-2]
MACVGVTDDTTAVDPVQIPLSDQFMYARLNWNLWPRSTEAVHASVRAMTSESGWRPKLKRQRTLSHHYPALEQQQDLFSKLPTEIVEQILLGLPFIELVKLRAVNKAFNEMLKQPRMYPVIAVSADRPPKPRFLNGLTTILPSTRSLTLRSFSLGHLGLLLPNLTECLTSLDLSFSTVTDDLLSSVAYYGALHRVKQLRLKACRGVHDVASLASDLPDVELLDLSWSGVASLPSNCGDVLHQEDLTDSSPTDFDSLNSDDSGFFDIVPSDLDSKRSVGPTPFQRLRHLSLSSVFYLPTSSLSLFLNNLPPSLQSLDLSYLALTRSILASINLPPSSEFKLQTLDLTGNDRLTMIDIAELKDKWGDKVEKIDHGPLLESEEEDDVRRFVEMLARIHG